MKRKISRRKTPAGEKRSLLIEPSSGEPVWIPAVEYDQLGGLLNWYSYNKSSDDARKYFFAYFAKKPKTEIEHIKNLDKFALSTTVGWLARICALSSAVDPKWVTRLDDEYKKLLKISVKVETKVEEKVKAKPDVQKAIREQLAEHVGEIEYQLDSFLTNKYKSDFKPLEFYKEKEFKLPHIRIVIETYRSKLLSELLLVKAGKDEQLNEGYAHLSTGALNKYIKFVELIISDAEEWQKTVKTIQTIHRKPRARKPKPAGKQVEKLKYLREHDGLKSILPSTIIGSTHLVVYNVKYRTLGVYYCANPHGFTVKGCTIQNFDETISVHKKLRKPEQVLPKLDNIGKVALRNLLYGVKAKEKTLTGRINSDTLLLKVL